MSNAYIIGESATKVLLDAVTVSGASNAWLPVSIFKSWHIIITGVATVAIEVTNNVMTGVTPSPLAANWLQLAKTTKTFGFENHGGAFKACRANVLSISSGNVTVILGT